jgi:hypothetical protein
VSVRHGSRKGPAVKKAQHLAHYYSVVVVVRVWGTLELGLGSVVSLGWLNIRTCRRAGTASVVDSTVAVDPWSPLLPPWYPATAALVRLVSLTTAGERRKPVQNGLHCTSSLVLAMPFDPRSAWRSGGSRRLSWSSCCWTAAADGSAVVGGRGMHASAHYVYLPTCPADCRVWAESKDRPFPSPLPMWLALPSLLFSDPSIVPRWPAVSVCGLLLAALLWRTTTCRRRKWPPSQPQAHASSAAMMNGWPRRLVNAWPALPPGWRWTTATD